MVSLVATPYYHCVSRCVRRAILCGANSQSGQCYEHRRQLIQDRMCALAAAFVIDLCAFAVMSNHYHVVLHVDRQEAEGWDDKEVVRRWQELFTGHPMAQCHLAGDELLEVELKQVSELVALWRNRLMDIIWYMRFLNEAIARQANEEYDCTGVFGEGRFKSQALLAVYAYLGVLNVLFVRLLSICPCQVDYAGMATIVTAINPLLINCDANRPIPKIDATQSESCSTLNVVEKYIMNSRRIDLYHVINSIAAILAVVVIVAGCAGYASKNEEMAGANEQISIARSDVNNAISAGGNEFAPLHVKSAMEKIAGAEQEMTANKYSRARQLAENAQVDAQLAESVARAEKAQRAADELQKSRRILREEMVR